MLTNITITAGQTLEYFEPGDFFRIMEAPDPLGVIFYLNGAEVARVENVSEGYAERFRAGGFDRYRITSATTQAIQFVSRLGADVAYDKPPTGDVSILGTVPVSVQNPIAQGGAFTQVQATVTNASTTIDAANAARRYLLVQNNDATGIVYVTVDGTAATTAKGVKLVPGASLEFAGYCPTGAINAIGSIASNANVIVVEG